MTATKNKINSRFAGLRFYLIVAFVLGLFSTDIGRRPVLAADPDGFLKVTGPCRQTFPQDHGAHPGYRTEWWYYTGNLTDAGQRRFGFQLTFFRSQLLPPAAEQSGPLPVSRWRSNQIFMAHAAITDLQGQRHLKEEKMSRGAMALAGVQWNGGQVTINVLDWQAVIGPDSHRLSASADAFAMDLTLVPLKPPVLHGDAGYSRKGVSAERASCYYSFTRLDTSGVLNVNGHQFQVSGTGWMDHEFGSGVLDPDVIGWDWFSLQLSDQTELMVFLLRQEQSHLNPASSGTFVMSDGQIRALHREDIRVEVLGHWKSPHSGARYPSHWRLTIAKLDLTLNIVSNLPDQEMRTPRTTGVTYWEGSVHMDGQRQGRPVDGSGYVEMTGYAEPFDAPM